MNKGKLFAPFVTLLAAAITLGVCLRAGYNMLDMLWILLGVVLVFYIISYFIQCRVAKFIEANEEKAREEAEKEGAVIEKDAPEAEEFGYEDNESMYDGEDMDEDGAGESGFRTRPS